MSVVSKVQKIPEYNKLFICGFIRKYANHSKVPYMIECKILLYQYEDEMYFYEMKKNGIIYEISDDRLSVKNTTRDSGLYELDYIGCEPSLKSTCDDCIIWSFRIKRDFDGIRRGICFAIYGGDGIEYWHESDGILNIGKNPGDPIESHREFSNGDRVSYILDLNQRSFKGKINENPEFVIAKNIETSNDIWYSMRAYVMLKHDEITLVGFWHQFHDVSLLKT